MDIQAELQSLPLFSGCDDPTCELLPEGRTNRNYRVDTGGQVYFVRLSAPGHAEHGIDRRKEYAAIENLHTAGLGPRPIYFCPENQIIVTEFIDAPTWTLDKLKTPDALGSFGRAIADLHRLPSGDAVYDIVEVARHYLDELRGSDVVSSADLHLLSKARDLVADLCDETDFGMCHNDLWYGNVIDDGGIKIIDLEMAGRGDIYFDLACFVHFHGLDGELLEIFLTAYASRASLPLSRPKLAQMRRGVHLREALWALTQMKNGITGEFYTRCSTGHLEALRTFSISF